MLGRVWIQTWLAERDLLLVAWTSVEQGWLEKVRRNEAGWIGSKETRLAHKVKRVCWLGISERSPPEVQSCGAPPDS